VFDQPLQVVLKVNGKEQSIVISITDTLADTLREKLGLTGTKLMCNEGNCGSCTVLLDGNPVLSCLTLAIECEGIDILTIEGLENKKTGALHPLQKAFVEHHGVQCGICTAGVILSAKALLDNNPQPTEDEVREAIAGNLCRCGNYKRITESVLAAAELMKGNT
jgi:aerobic carbon-monoxide dehydrogenase small subunit